MNPIYWEQLGNGVLYTLAIIGGFFIIWKICNYIADKYMRAF